MDTVVIGLDGGDWRVLDRLVAEGRLEHISRLLDRGARGDLTSTVPPVSPPAWTTLHTGKNPGKHGIFDFNRYDQKYRRRTINATDRQSPPFWLVMNDGGVSTGLFKVPFTYPMGAIDGFAVTGFPTPSSVEDFAKPAALAESLESPEDLFEDWSYLHDGDLEAFAENLVEVARNQTALLLDIIETYETDYLMTVYDGCDRIQHFYWKYFDESHSRHVTDHPLAAAIPSYYEVVDHAIGEILEAGHVEMDVIILSDHGFGPLTNDIRIDEWLDDNGFLERIDTTTAAGASVSVASRLVDLIWSSVERLGFDDAVKAILPEEIVLSGGQLRNKPDRAINWSETQAFFTNLSGQAIHINLAERFSKGIVSESEYDDVVETLREALLQLQNPHNEERLIKAVHHRSEVFSGPAVQDAPDLLIETAPGHTLKDGPSDNLVEPSTQYGWDRSGDHRRQGIFVAAGPSFTSGRVGRLSLTDIAPTLLYLHNCPVPESMDGSVHREALAIDDRPIQYTDGYEETATDRREWTDEEADEMEQRLKDMGYIG
jgi:predicted AlkP superfamily phosphohydrolase/phosphomutase